MMRTHSNVRFETVADIPMHVVSKKYQNFQEILKQINFQEMFTYYFFLSFKKISPTSHPTKMS